MNIRKYNISDISQIIVLFYETVQTINAKDYSPEQIKAWAPPEEKESLLSNWQRTRGRT